MSSIFKMSVREEHICRLCLKVTKDEFEIDEFVKQMFEILLLKLDLDITRDPIICQDCLEVAKKCLNFKYTCICTEQTILSYSVLRKKFKYNINVIYEEMEQAQTAMYEAYNVCRFCMARLKRNGFTSLNVLMNGSMFEMLSEYMAQMDFTTIENPIICSNCSENLDGYFQFVQNSLDIEKKIKTCCEEKGTDSVGQVKLSDVLLFTFTDILEYPGKCSQTCKIKQEHTEFVNAEAYSGLIKQKELNIKHEETIWNENSYSIALGNKLDVYGDTFSLKERHKETKSDMICWKNMKHNTDCSHVQKCDLTKYMLVHKDVSERNMYNCSLCAYETKHKSSLNRHNTLVHKDVSEIKMYKCLLCAYEAKLKCSLNTHMLVHKDVSERNMYNCSLCAYETQYKSSLNRHNMLVHKDVSEIKLYKCSLCPYEAKHKGSFTTHMLVHKNVSEIKMYKCSLCAFEANRKSSLNRHMLVHKDVSEIKLYKCSLCAYKTKHKGTLKPHMLVHKHASEITMYKCPLCSYESKRKRDLDRHMLLVHNEISEIKKGSL